VLPAGGSSVVGRAAAALEESNGAILHIEMGGEQHNPDGSVVAWRSESWELNESPYTSRKIEVGPEGIRAETLARGETQELYDAQTNTIYIASQDELAAARPMPKMKIVSESRLREITRNAKGDAFVVYGKAKGYSVVATKAGAERLRRQRAREAQRSGADQAIEEPFRAEILALLRSGRAQETGSRRDRRAPSASSRRTAGGFISSTRPPTLPSSGRPRGTAVRSRSASRSTRISR